MKAAEPHTPYPKITMHLERSAEYLRDNVLRGTIRNGETKDVDFSPYLELGISFRPLKMPEVFRDFRV